MNNLQVTPRLIAKAQGFKRYVGIPCINGHDGERYVRNHTCVDCHNEEKKSSRTYAKVGRPRKYEAFIGPPKPKHKKFVPLTETDKWIVRSKANKKSSKRKGLSYAYYQSLIVTHCPLLGLELTYENCGIGVVPQNYATLDRIDSNKGYVPGNVHIVSFRANTLKNSSTLEELKLIVKNLEMLRRSA